MVIRFGMTFCFFIFDFFLIIVDFFATTFSRHGRINASIILLIWLNKKRWPVEQVRQSRLFHYKRYKKTSKKCYYNSCNGVDYPRGIKCKERKVELDQHCGDDCFLVHYSSLAFISSNIRMNLSYPTSAARRRRPSRTIRPSGVRVTLNGMALKPNNSWS